MLDIHGNPLDEEEDDSDFVTTSKRTLIILGSILWIVIISVLLGFIYWMSKL